jgi:hypothetical protein
MEQSYAWKATSWSADQEIPNSFMELRTIILFTKARKYFLTRATLISSNPLTLFLVDQVYYNSPIYIYVPQVTSFYLSF